MLSSMNYYGVCHCLYQYSLFYHVVTSITIKILSLWVSHSLSPLLEEEIIYVEETEQSFLKNTCQVWLPYYKLYIMILSYVCLLSDPFDCLENCANCDCKLTVLEETI